MRPSSNIPHFVILTLPLLFGLSHSFFPSDWRENLFGRGGASHVRITREVIENILLGPDSYFPGEISKLTKSMMAARDATADANSDVDSNESHDSGAHFDGENFNGGQARIMGLVRETRDALGKNDAVAARKFVGQALHTVQDFYAHSNWVEMGQTGTSPESLERSAHYRRWCESR
jgi:hypothetical protein